ncbi:hypothetical protein Cni_G09410 [Canna indica]|uniref:Uncharacterized protein n=1 Tax=Canna indica TaxID=4628 RepID=A0AAQ3K2G0_9LILI|nr:hypothetical protein Cni_G09410 [Canna indica]
MIVGMALFTDSYGLFCIASVLKVLTALDQDAVRDHDRRHDSVHGLVRPLIVLCIAPMIYGSHQGWIYYVSKVEKPGATPLGVVSAVVGVALVGTVIGQLFFSVLGDRIGR